MYFVGLDVSAIDALSVEGFSGIYTVNTWAKCSLRHTIRGGFVRLDTLMWPSMLMIISALGHLQEGVSMSYNQIWVQLLGSC